MSFRINSNNKTLNPSNLLPGFDAAQLFQTPVDSNITNKLSNNGVLQWDSQNQVWTTGTGPFEPSGNLNLECGNIKEVTGLEFCDGTFIGTTGPTGTLQISSSSVIFTNKQPKAKIVLGCLTNNIRYSFDGINYFTGTYSPLTTNGNRTNGIYYSEKRKIWIAGGQTSTLGTGKNLAYSYDGINFTEANYAGVLFTRVFAISYSETLDRFVAVGGRQTHSPPATTTVAYSNDGINWLPGSPTNAFGVEGYCVVYSPDLNQWVISGRDRTLTSTNGINWTAVGTSAESGNSVAWFGGSVQKYCLCRGDQFGSRPTTIFTSTNGSTWTSLGTTVFTSAAQGVAVNPDNTLCVIVGTASGGKSGLCYTTDLVNFTFVPGIPSLRSVTYSEYFNAWYAAGNAGIIYTSNDGINWSQNSTTGIGNLTNFSIGASSLSGLQITTDSASSKLDDFNQLYILGESVGIGTTGPDSSSLLDISSTSKGFLPPRMTGVQANAIVSPAVGLLVYVTTTGGSPFNFTTKGWWGYDGSTWIKLG